MAGEEEVEEFDGKWEKRREVEGISRAVGKRRWRLGSE